MPKGQNCVQGPEKQEKKNKMKFKLFLAPNQNAALKCKIRNAKCAWQRGTENNRNKKKEKKGNNKMA